MQLPSAQGWARSQAIMLMQPPFGSLAGAVELAGPSVHPHEQPGQPGGRQRVWLATPSASAGL